MRVSGVARTKVKKMKLEMMLVALVLSLLMAKKKETGRKFGQLTLDLAGQALEYLKSDPKGIVRRVQRAEWMNKHHADSLGYQLPPWVLPKDEQSRQQFRGSERIHDVCILHDADPAVMPLLVHQGSALQGLEEVLVVAQEDGALVEDDGKRLVLDMGDGHLVVRFVRNTKAGKFARFVVRAE